MEATRRTTRIGALAGGTVLLLAACTATQPGNVRTPEGGTPQGGTLAPVDLTWWALTDQESLRDAVEGELVQFEEANPGVTITFVLRDIDAHKEALRTAQGTDAFPDLYFNWAGLGLGGEFVLAGASEDLTDAAERLGWEDRFVPPVVADATQYGGWHGVPFATHGQGLYYRTDLFEAAGITEEPTTYEELIAVNDQLKDSGVFPISFGGSVNWHLMRLLDNILEHTCGAETHDALKSLEANWATEPCATEAFVEFDRWVDDYIIPDFMGIDNDESTQLWYGGQVAMALEGDWMVQQLIDQGQDPANFGFFPFPHGTDRLYAFSEMTYVSAHSSDAEKEAAIAFLDFFSSPEIQEEHLGTFGAVSVVEEVGAAEDQPLEVEWAETFASAPGTYVNADQAFPLEITTEYWRIHNRVATGDLPAEDAAAQFQQFIDSRE